MSMYSPSDDTLEAPARSESQASEEEEGSQSQDDDRSGHTLVSPNKTIPSVPNLDSLSHLREVGHSTAVCWQLSSSKPGNGVEQLRDVSTETYWQSDGITQPHWIQLHFRRRLAISHVALYLDFPLDESYTPKALSIEYGMTTQDLMTARKVELVEPNGWCIVSLSIPKLHLLRVSVRSMHQNGRDTHVRRLCVFSSTSAEQGPSQWQYSAVR